jgi:hypothetical protein
MDENGNGKQQFYSMNAAAGTDQPSPAAQQQITRGEKIAAGLVAVLSIIFSNKLILDKLLNKIIKFLLKNFPDIQ